MSLHPIILFDGVCNLCNNTVDFVIRRKHGGQFRFVALQSETGEKLRQRFSIPADTDSVVLIYNEDVYFESAAILKTAWLLSYPWRLAVLFKIIPLKWRNKFYRWIASNRYKWFGKRETCRIPTAAERSQFPEWADLKR